MSVEQATAGGGGVPLLRVLKAPIDPRTWTAALYLVASLAVGIFWFVVLVTGISVGTSLVIVWVGLPILGLTMLAWRGGAWLERRWVGLMLGARIPEPYRPLPSGGLLARWLAMAADPATWKDFAYLDARIDVKWLGWGRGEVDSAVPRRPPGRRSASGSG